MHRFPSACKGYRRSLECADLRPGLTCPPDAAQILFLTLTFFSSLPVPTTSCTRQTRGRSKRVEEKRSSRESRVFRLLLGNLESLMESREESRTPQLEFLKTIPLRLFFCLIIFCTGYFNAISGTIYSPLDFSLLPSVYSTL